MWSQIENRLSKIEILKQHLSYDVLEKALGDCSDMPTGSLLQKSLIFQLIQQTFMLLFQRICGHNNIKENPKSKQRMFIIMFSKCVKLAKLLPKFLTFSKSCVCFLCARVVVTNIDIFSEVTACTVDIEVIVLCLWKLFGTTILALTNYFSSSVII